MLTRIYLFLLLITASWYGISMWIGFVTIQPLEVLLGLSLAWFIFLPPSSRFSPVPFAAIWMLIVMAISLALTKHSHVYGIVHICKLLLGILAFSLMRRMIRDRQTLHKAWWWLCWGILISAGFGIFAYVLRYVGISLPFARGAAGFGRVYGLNSDPNRFGALTSVVTAMVFGSLLSSQRRRSGLIAIVLLLIVSLFLSGSRGALFAFITSVIIGWFIIRFFAGTKLAVSKNTFRYALVPLVLLIITFFIFPSVFDPVMRRLLGKYATVQETQTIKGNIRFLMIQNSMPSIVENPVFGSGPGTWGMEVGVKMGELSPHNTYLGYLVENGILGLGAYLFIVLWLYARTIRTVRLLRGYPDPELRGMGIGLILAMTSQLVNMNTFESQFLSYVWVFFGFVSVYSDVARDELEYAAYYNPSEEFPPYEVGLAYNYS